MKHQRYNRHTIPGPGWYFFKPGWFTGLHRSMILLSPSCLTPEFRKTLDRGTYTGPLTKEEEEKYAVHSWEWHETRPHVAIA